MILALFIAAGLCVFTLHLLHKISGSTPSIDIDVINQSKLDKYLSSNLSPKEIGLRYERYIGYLYEKDGYDVKYNGAVEGFGDQGRDLIVKGDRETIIIQAKCWAKQKQIQEKYIHQLYGTIEQYRRTENKIIVRGVFYTTASYSQKAIEAARSLDIELRTEEQNRDYPMIKCNVSYNTGEKIYHFPFDEWYDTIKIKAHKGAFFAKTVKEATSKGFRRARKLKKTG